jgi:hypothetical protein
MKGDDSEQHENSVEDDSIEIADAVARAAHIWIRSLFLNESQNEDERQALAGGLVAGLCERLSLNPATQELVAYVYSLLDDEGSEALSVSRKMLERPAPRLKRSAYERGRSEAAEIVEMLAYHDRRRTSSGGGAKGTKNTSFRRVRTNN